MKNDNNNDITEMKNEVDKILKEIKLRGDNLQWMKKQSFIETGLKQKAEEEFQQDEEILNMLFDLNQTFKSRISKNKNNNNSNENENENEESSKDINNESKSESESDSVFVFDTLKDINNELDTSRNKMRNCIKILKDEKITDISITLSTEIELRHIMVRIMNLKNSKYKLLGKEIIYKSDEIPKIIDNIIIHIKRKKNDNINSSSNSNNNQSSQPQPQTEKEKEKEKENENDESKSKSQSPRNENGIKISKSEISDDDNDNENENEN
jgi:hypothetical protein